MISTKGRYALRMMIDIAQQEADGPVKAKDIASRQEISLKYMEQIINILAKANFVVSSRGAYGGYRLTRLPGEYKVGDILRLTEGSMAPVSCLESEKNSCTRQKKCTTLKLWQELDSAITGVIDKYTLEDLMDWNDASCHNSIL